MATTRTEQQQPQEWTPELETHWKDPKWWAQGTAEEHLALDDLFDKHINEDFKLSDWVEPKANQEMWFVASAGNLIKKTVRGYDFGDHVYFMVNPETESESRVRGERIWANPADAMIFKLRQFASEMRERTTITNPAARDSQRMAFRIMLRFMFQQLESL